MTFKRVFAAMLLFYLMLLISRYELKYELRG